MCGQNKCIFPSNIASDLKLERNLIGNRNWFQLNQNIFYEPNVYNRSFLSKKAD